MLAICVSFMLLTLSSHKVTTARQENNGYCGEWFCYVCRISRRKVEVSLKVCVGFFLFFVFN